VHFIDRSLRPNVNIMLEGLNGTVAGLSSDDAERAVVDLRGTVDKTARATTTGRLNPWNEKQPTALKIALQEMNLFPEDPYARKYLGYQLKQGTLSLDLSYQLADKTLTSQNRITLDQLVLGEKVDSPEATQLPIRLALAVLKDRNGRIELEVPVDGSLADPDFHLGKVISNAIGGVFNKIVTSPFSVLSALLGGKGEALSFVEFEPGVTNLGPASLEKLDLLAHALSERPELELAIEGGTDSETDLAALRSGKFTYEKGGAALVRMSTPVAAAMPLHGEGPGLETIDATSVALQTLAAERTRTVQRYLLQTGKVPAERISITKATRESHEQARRVYFRLQ
jgi:outer membrane protein OmpA-like peptidoglycan-associated protein